MLQGTCNPQRLSSLSLQRDIFATFRLRTISFSCVIHSISSTYTSSLPNNSVLGDSFIAREAIDIARERCVGRRSMAYPNSRAKQTLTERPPTKLAVAMGELCPPSASLGVSPFLLSVYRTLRG